MKKILFLLSGFLLLALGALGAVLPILPTFPFLLGSSFCFLKSSAKLNDWFCSTKLYKTHVETFIRQKGLTLKAKLFILIPVSAMLIALIIAVDSLAMRITISILLIAKIIVFIKMKTIKEEKLNDA